MGFSTRLTKGVLVSLAITGYLATWNFSFKNGQFDKINTLIASPQPMLPESMIPMRTHWTGVKALDDGLVTFQAFFYPILSGQNPALSLVGFHFYGQGMATWLLMLVESFRVGNSWKPISFITIFGLLVENVAMAVVLPAWCLIHLLTSPSVSDSLAAATRQTSLLVHPSELQVLPWSLAIGCGVPTIMLVFFSSFETQSPLYASSQFWILVRQIHPLLTAIVHLLLSVFAPVSDVEFTTKSDRNRNVSRALRRVYSFAKYVAIITHCLALTLAVGPTFLPSLVLGIWKPVPFWADDAPAAETISAGSFMFLQWDELISCVSILVWAFALNRDALTTHVQGSGFLSTIWRVVSMTAIGGPAAAAVSLIEERDEKVLESVENTTTIVKKTS